MGLYRRSVPTANTYSRAHAPATSKKCKDTSISTMAHVASTAPQILSTTRPSLSNQRSRFLGNVHPVDTLRCTRYTGFTALRMQINGATSIEVSTGAHGIPSTSTFAYHRPRSRLAICHGMRTMMMRPLSSKSIGESTRGYPSRKRRRTSHTSALSSTGPANNRMHLLNGESGRQFKPSITPGVR